MPVTSTRKPSAQPHPSATAGEPRPPFDLPPAAPLHCGRSLSPIPSVLVHGSLRLDLEARQAQRDGRQLDLTPREFELLGFLAARPGRTFSRAQLLQEVWASRPEWQGAATVTEHVHRLRAKLRSDPDSPEMLLTVKGAGYRFDPGEPATSDGDGSNAVAQPSHDAVLVVVGTTIRFASPAARELMAPEDPAGVCGRDVLDYVGKSSIGAAMAHFASTKMRRSPRPASVSITRMDGSEVLVEMASTPVKLAGQHATQLMMWEQGSHDPSPVGTAQAELNETCDGRSIDLRSLTPPRASPAIAGHEEGTDDATELRRAISNGEFIVHYQPVVELEHSRVQGVEALVRWQHPTRGLLLPGDFMALAERSGAILAIGEHVLQSACRQAQTWRHAGHDLHVSVNLSARQLTDRQLPERVAAVMAATSMPPGRLWLEVTETDLVQDVAQAQVVLREIDDVGARISIDDFGTGWASLTYVHEFPIRQLKIDGSFVRALGHTRSAPAIISSIISLGRDLGLDVVAEGIETDDQHVRLLRLGCRLGQGYLFGHPRGPEALDIHLGLHRSPRFELAGKR